MTPQKRKASSTSQPLTLKKATQAAKRRNATRISDHAHLIPALSATIGRLTDVELRDAMLVYWSAIVHAKSAEEQVRHICTAIVAHAVCMRGVHTGWPYTLPPMLKQHARYAKLGTTYYLDDMREFCAAAIAHPWQGFAA
ncbi:MAG: hypothetical protein WA777_01165 [Rhodanobacter sp.]